MEIKVVAATAAFEGAEDGGVVVTEGEGDLRPASLNEQVEVKGVE